MFTADIDRNVDACTNFYDYANGAWRAANPIPPSMNRWSRRWASGELSKERLRAILEDVSKRGDWPARSIDQQIADFYGSCMDEARINALGSKPIQPLLRDIDRIQTREKRRLNATRTGEMALAVVAGDVHLVCPFDANRRHRRSLQELLTPLPEARSTPPSPARCGRGG